MMMTRMLVVETMCSETFLFATNSLVSASYFFLTNTCHDTNCRHDDDHQDYRCSHHDVDSGDDDDSDDHFWKVLTWGQSCSPPWCKTTTQHVPSSNCSKKYITMKLMVVKKYIFLSEKGWLKTAVKAKSRSLTVKRRTGSQHNPFEIALHTNSSRFSFPFIQKQIGEPKESNNKKQKLAMPKDLYRILVFS